MKLVWFRNDLRLADHPALYQACQQARQDGQPVMACYAVTPGQWQEHYEAPVKLGFRQDALNQVSQGLAELGVPLLTLASEDYRDLPGRMADLCQQYRVQSLWFNEENWANEQLRDQAVVEQLKPLGVQSHVFANELLIGAEQLQTLQGQPYKVFTPWYKLWLKRLQNQMPRPLPRPASLAAAVPANSVKLPGARSYRTDLWPASEIDAQQRLEDFVLGGLVGYRERRDFPATGGTSLMSAYLASGVISAGQCVTAVLEHCFEQGREWREDHWLRELAWRDFYHYLMIVFPHLSMNQPFRVATAALQWESNEAGEMAWRRGLTGFPLIDAAMRQLSQTGWMHNRLRMLTASFYSKLLLLDWRGGERYFMEQLIDGDFAANNGGWQWSASTGCDASPWFRIFNPTRQSERFDADGHFIRKLVPELAELPAKLIHNPPTKLRGQLGYPQPIVDYSLARKRVLDRFAQLNTGTAG